jgi:outer membrane protein TolC
MFQHQATPRAVAGLKRSAPGDRIRARRRTHASKLAAMALCALASLPAAAQVAPPLTLAEAQRIAVDRSAQIASQRSMAEAAREMAGPAAELPDPQLIVGFENVPTGGAERWSLTKDGMTMTRIGIMQEFPRAAKRELRAERARRDAARGEVAAEAAALAVSRETASAWLALYFARRAERAIAAQIAEADLQLAMAEATYRGGRGGPGETLAARAAILELRNKALEAGLASERARLSLARYVGAAVADRPQGELPDVAKLPREASALVDVAAQPEVRLAEAQAAVLDAESELARAGRLPDWSAELSYGIRGSDYSNMVTLMVRVDLPWSPGTRQDREYAAKLKERDAAREMREDARRMREAETQQMLAEWTAARAQAARIRDEMIPLARARTEAALAAYRGGGAPLAPVLESRRAELEAELALVAMEQAAARAWAWLANTVYPAGQS